MASTSRSPRPDTLSLSTGTITGGVGELSNTSAQTCEPGCTLTSRWMRDPPWETTLATSSVTRSPVSAASSGDVHGATRSTVWARANPGLAGSGSRGSDNFGCMRVPSSPDAGERRTARVERGLGRARAIRHSQENSTSLYQHGGARSKPQRGSGASANTPGVDRDVDRPARRDHDVVGADLAADEELAALASVESGADLQRLVDRHRREVADRQLAGERRLLQLGDDEPGDVVERGGDDAAVRPTGCAFERVPQHDVPDDLVAVVPDRELDRGRVRRTPHGAILESEAHQRFGDPATHELEPIARRARRRPDERVHPPLR